MAQIIDMKTGKTLNPTEEELARQREIEEKQRPIREEWFRKVDEYNDYLDSIEGDDSVTGTDILFRLFAMIRAEKKYREDMNAIDGGRRTTVMEDAFEHMDEALAGDDGDEE